LGFIAVHTGHEAHPVSRAIDIGSFPRVQRPKRGSDHPLPSCVALRIVGAIRPSPYVPLHLVILVWVCIVDKLLQNIAIYKYNFEYETVGSAEHTKCEINSNV
jgi:hypothetical protein